MQNTIGDNFNFHSSSTVTIAVSFQQFQFSVLNKRCISDAPPASPPRLFHPPNTAFPWSLACISFPASCLPLSTCSGTERTRPGALNGNFQKLEKFPPESDNKIKLFSTSSVRYQHLTCRWHSFRARRWDRTTNSVKVPADFLVFNYLADYSITKVVLTIVAAAAD